MPTPVPDISTMNLSGLKSGVEAAKASGSSARLLQFERELKGRDGRIPTHEQLAAACEMSTGSDRREMDIALLRKSFELAGNPDFDITKMDRLDTRGISLSKEDNPPKTYCQEILKDGKSTGECLIVTVVNKPGTAEEWTSPENTTVITAVVPFDKNTGHALIGGARGLYFATNLAEFNNIRKHPPEEPSKTEKFFRFFGRHRDLEDSWDTPDRVSHNLLNGLSTIREFYEDFKSTVGCTVKEYWDVQADLLEEGPQRERLESKKVREDIMDSIEGRYAELAKEVSEARKSILTESKQAKLQQSHERMITIMSDPGMLSIIEDISQDERIVELYAGTGAIPPAVERFLRATYRSPQEYKDARFLIEKHLDMSVEPWKDDEDMKALQGLFSRSDLDKADLAIIESLTRKVSLRYPEYKQRLERKLNTLFEGSAIVRSDAYLDEKDQVERLLPADTSVEVAVLQQALQGARERLKGFALLYPRSSFVVIMREKLDKWDQFVAAKDRVERSRVAFKQDEDAIASLADALKN